MGLNKQLQKKQITKVKSNILEKELDKLLNRSTRYECLVRNKKEEYYKLVTVDDKGHNCVQLSDTDKVNELCNCIALTETKIKKMLVKIDCIEAELSERIIIGEI